MMGYARTPSGFTARTEDLRRRVFMTERRGADSYLARYSTGEAAGRNAAGGEGSGPPHKFPPAHDLFSN